jgi:HEAT repeat protein
VPPKAESVPAPTPKPPAKSVALAPLKADPAPRPPATEPAPAAGNPDPAKIPPRVENIDTLSDDLNNPNTVVRRTAIVGLASRLRDQDTAVRRQAISRLADIGPDAELVSDDIRAAVEDADPEVRTTAKRICGRLESLAADRKRQETRRLVVECAKRLKAKDPVERVKALMDLEKFGPDAEVVGEQVIETMRDEIGAVQTAAAAALEKINPKVHPHIVAIVRGPKSGRRAAVMALGGLGEDARIALPILLQCNDNAFLWGGGNPKAGRYHEDLFPLIAKVAPKDKRFVTAVLTYVAAPNPQRDRTIRDRRLAGIAQLESLEADTTKKIDALVEALADIDTVVPVICALEGYGTDAKPAIPKLRELKSSRIESIRDAAIKALAKIE